MEEGEFVGLIGQNGAGKTTLTKMTGRCSSEALSGLLILTGWCIAMQVLIVVTWNRYRIKYDGVLPYN